MLSLVLPRTGLGLAVEAAGLACVRLVARGLQFVMNRKAHSCRWRLSCNATGSTSSTKWRWQGRSTDSAEGQCWCETDVAHPNADGEDVVGMAIGDKARFRALLASFKGGQAASSPDLIQVARRLLKGFHAKHEAGRILQETTADDFNLLDTLQVTGEEIRHSMMLARFLTVRQRTTGQSRLPPVFEARRLRS